MFDPRYKLTNKIVSMLIAIAEARSIISRSKLLPRQELRLRRQALIRMTHASTGIEGNALNIRQVEAVADRKKIDAPARDVYEVENYLKAIRYISKVVEEKRPITERVVLQIHKLVTAKTLPENQSGYYRSIPIYVVRRRLGMPQEVLYTGPDAKKVPQLMKALMRWVQEGSNQDIHPIIVAGIVHQEIAAIHPFVDGNGRTARALATLVLYQRGYDFRRLFALEDYYNRNRAEYYKVINIGKNYDERRDDFTPWLEYFVRGFKEEIDGVKAQIVSLSKRKVSDAIASQIYLAKDQLQIIDFLEQMGKITVADVMDVLQCPRRTAQLQLQKLKKLSMITQVGKGPSSAYVLAR
jgi:Fic family protein